MVMPAFKRSGSDADEKNYQGPRGLELQGTESALGECLGAVLESLRTFRHNSSSFEHFKLYFVNKTVKEVHNLFHASNQGRKSISSISKSSNGNLGYQEWGSGVGSKVWGGCIWIMEGYPGEEESVWEGSGGQEPFS